MRDENRMHDLIFEHIKDKNRDLNSLIKEVKSSLNLISYYNEKLMSHTINKSLFLSSFEKNLTRAFENKEEDDVRERSRFERLIKKARWETHVA